MEIRTVSPAFVEVLATGYDTVIGKAIYTFGDYS